MFSKLFQLLLSGVCVFTSIHREGFICLNQLGLLGNRSTSASSLYLYFGMQNLTFQLAALSCSYTSSGLTSIRLAFRTWGLHSPLTAVTFGRHYIMSRSAFASALTRDFAIYLGKVNVTTNFSIKSSPWQST